MPAGHTINVDGLLTDWLPGDRIDDALTAGYRINATSDATYFYFSLTAPVAIGTNTTVWLNTDRNAATGYQIFGNAGGAEYNVNFAADGTLSLYSGGAGQTLVASGLTAVRSADGLSIEFRIAKTAIGNPLAIDTLYDINDAHLPANELCVTAVHGVQRHRNRPCGRQADRHRLFGHDSQRLLQQDRLFAAVHVRPVAGDAGRNSLRHPDRERPDQPDHAGQVRRAGVPLVPQCPGKPGHGDHQHARAGDQAVRHRADRRRRVHGGGSIRQRARRQFLCADEAAVRRHPGDGRERQLSRSRRRARQARCCPITTMAR